MIEDRENVIGDPIEGFGLFRDAVTPEEAAELIRRIRENPYMKPHEKAGIVTMRDTYEYDLPAWLAFFTQRLVEYRLFPSPPTQALITQYPPGTHVRLHTDCDLRFGEPIAGLSLGDVTTFTLELEAARRKLAATLHQGSLYHMKGPARYEALHATQGCCGIRYSITFRQMKERNGPSPIPSP